MLEYKLPELGEDIESAEVINVYVKEGDTVEKDDPLLELETDKAALDLPSPTSGKIAELLVKSGDTINVGQVVVKIDDSGTEQTEQPSEEEPEKTKEEAGGEEEKKTKGKEESTKKEAEREEKTVPKRGEKEKAEEETSEEKEKKHEEPEEEPEKAEGGEITIKEKELAPASPSIRKLARELGLEINRIPGSGAGGRVTSEDVKDYAKELIERKEKEVVGEEDQLPDFSRWGEIERVSMSSVRKITSQNLTKAWEIPHVTQHDKADITDLDKLRKQYKDKAAQAGGNLTITPIIMKVVASALKLFPKFNCSIDVHNYEIIYKKYVNVGFAVDTERGLLVPNVRNADSKNIIDISVELADMSERARNKKLKPEEMQGGTFTVSNLGGIGGTYFTPIIYSPEVSILGVSRSYTEPVYIDGEINSRLMMPLSLSYDHRIIDGAEGIRFLRWVVEALEQPFKVLFEGEFNKLSE